MQEVDGQKTPQSHSTSSPVPVIDTSELFGESTEVRLRHRGQEYRLRITKQGKLILTK